MKYLILFFFLPLALQAQQTEPFKKCNAINIGHEGTPMQAYVHCGKSIAQQGYVIGSSDSDFLTLATEWKESGNIRHRLMVSVLEMGGHTIIRVTGEMDVLGPSQIDYRGMKGSPAAKAWAIMHAVSRSLGDSDISYSSI